MRMWWFQSRSLQPGTWVPRQEAGAGVGRRMWATNTHFDVYSLLQKRHGGTWKYVSHRPPVPLVGLAVSIWERGWAGAGTVV